MKSSKITEFAALLCKSVCCGTLKSVIFHSPLARDSEILKVRGSIKKISGKAVLQIEYFLTEGRVSHENLFDKDIEKTAQRLFDTFHKADLIDKNGSAALMISKKGAVNLVKKGNIGAETENAGESEALPSNDRDKQRLLRGNEEFLKKLGVSDENGRIHDKKQPKFRQICRFSEYIAEAAKKLCPEGELYVCDLCCGKSYLSFAAYHVLSEILGRKVRMSCVDLKKSVMEYCAAIASECGMDGMEFITMDISSFEPIRKPDLVISLHACDTATDMVLDFAVKHRADVILSTPCCHHQMNKELSCPTLDFIAGVPVLRQKLCTAATDALRLLKLESEGYRTDATEFIDPEDTPKNVMLRDYRIKNRKSDSSENKAKLEKYRAAFFLMYGKYPD